MEERRRVLLSLSPSFPSLSVSSFYMNTLVNLTIDSSIKPCTMAKDTQDHLPLLQRMSEMSEAQTIKDSEQPPKLLQQLSTPPLQEEKDRVFAAVEQVVDLF